MTGHNDLSEGTKAIVEKIATVVAEKFSEKLEKIIDQRIETHSLGCEVKKYRKIENLASAGIGGIIVAVVNWLLK
jgi:hypothetical protein